MTTSMLFVLALLSASIVLFATEKLRVDIVALLIVVALLGSGILTADEALRGFSNTATVTIAAMFVLSAGLFKTGAVNFMGELLGRVARKSFPIALISIMISIGVISMFINNTAAVAIFLPIVLGVAKETRMSTSKLLMPLSFASMLGGTCTLIGTSTNILVSSIAEQSGIEPFRMFEFSVLGLILFVAGTAYMLTIGVRMIPERRPAGDLVEAFGMNHYLAEVVLQPGGPSVDVALMDSSIVRDLDIDVLEVRRKSRQILLPSPYLVLRADDVLRVRGDVEKIRKLQEKEGVELRTEIAIKEGDLTTEETVLVEAVIAPNSTFVGRSVEEVQLRNILGATALAIRHRNELLHENLRTATLRAGDALLLEIRRNRLPALKAHADFVLVSEVDTPTFRKRKVIPALVIVAAVVGFAAFGVLPILATAIIGSVLMIVTRCIEAEEAYDAIDWQVIVLLAGVLSLGVALEKTGAAALLSTGIVSSVGHWGPVAIVSAFFAVTSLLTAVMSNGATAALLAPVAISTAAALGISARPLLMAVTFAASVSFMTPVGYQTNTIIYGPGQYRFADFLKVGTPLNIIVWIISTIMIPIIWPF
ncbi:MAG: SLC13 family permease [Gemmatimonadetes bacterium]|nr:SLC13 family permease [Gemmatimonadota bacterium]